MDELKNLHQEARSYIIGAGIGLMDLSEKSFGEGIIITINFAIQEIEKFDLNNHIYSMQKDRVSHLPQNGATLLIHKHESALKPVDYKPQVTFDNIRLGLKPGTCTNGFSLQSAIRLSEWMGCSDIIIYACDAHMPKRNKMRYYDGEYIYHHLYDKQVKGMRDFKFKIPTRFV